MCSGMAGNRKEKTMVKLFHGAHARLRNGVEIKGICAATTGRAGYFGVAGALPIWYDDGTALGRWDIELDVVEVLNKPQHTFNQLLQAGELEEGMLFVSPDGYYYKTVDVEGVIYIGRLASETERGQEPTRLYMDLKHHNRILWTTMIKDYTLVSEE